MINEGNKKEDASVGLDQQGTGTYTKGPLPKVSVSSDGLEAYMTLVAPGSNEKIAPFSMEDLVRILQDNNVVYGLHEKTLRRMVKRPMYGVKELVASGIPVDPGTPGEYEFHFNRNFSKKPTIREDGTADFYSIKTIELVKKGDVIVTYHPAIQGDPGKTVRGTEIEPKVVRDLPPIGGRGFERSEDGTIYTASVDGKIEYQNNRINVLHICEIEQDADMSMGNIDFSGDIVIRGGVSSGVCIRATGDITIHGLVENCKIHAGKDLYLLSGVKGMEMTEVSAKGNITAEFIEYADVTCGGNLQADVLFNCNVSCDGRIIMTGHRGGIIGGYASAVKGMDVSVLGNSFGTITKINAGIDAERLKEITVIKRRIFDLTSNIEKIKIGVEKFDQLGKERGISYREDPRRVQLLRIKIRDEAIVSESKIRLDKLEMLAEMGEDATIRVTKEVYPGVSVAIGNHRVDVIDEQREIEFKKSATGVRMVRIDD